MDNYLTKSYLIIVINIETVERKINDDYTDTLQKCTDISTPFAS